ncbi:hypothetical protein KC19_6G149700 [Ceratodon purpureus]|uniref:Uncharacterized protein n=1 Tax=Ceratodon purpureus TaxID=3225 RepID=A0A8T0HG40_CERPU|nr:hypothetical protein KC19_6G149700 [Ceratodon purpureus]
MFNYLYLTVVEQVLPESDTQAVIAWILLIAVSMSCAGEKKLTKVIVPDKWKEGASNTTEGGGRKINESKLLLLDNHNYCTVS